MHPVFDDQSILDQIYYDHSYAFSEIHYKDAIKNYYLKPSFQNPKAILTDSNENVDIETLDSKVKSESKISTKFKMICENILCLLYGDDYEVKSDQELKFECPGIDIPDKSKCFIWYKCEDWTIGDSNIRSKLYYILEEGFGSILLAPEGNDVCFNAAFRRTSKRINGVYSSAHWRMDICSTVHAYLLENLPDELLVVYIECLRQLFQRVKMKTILEQLNNWAQTTKILQRFSWTNVLEICHRENREAHVNLTELQWPLDPKLRPNVIHIYSERWTESTRMKSFSSRLRTFCNVSEFRFDDTGRLRKKFEILRSLVQTELKSKKSPIFVMGWDLGALLGLLSSIKIHGVTAGNFYGVICLGLPLKGLKGERGIIPEDYIHLLSKETLIVSGDMSGLGNGDDIEDFKDRMKGRVSIRHVNIGGCDHILRLSAGYGVRCQLSQDMVDMTILREVRHFIVDQVTPPSRTTTTTTTATLPSSDVTSMDGQYPGHRQQQQGPLSGRHYNHGHHSPSKDGATMAGSVVDRYVVRR